VKRHRVAVEAATCEICDAIEVTPGDFISCEGFLVCSQCAKNSSKLEKMRAKADAASQKERESS